MLPVDLKLGSIVEDGEGAIALLREMMSDLEPLFPSTHREAINRLGLLTMDRGINHPTDSVRTAAEILEREVALGAEETHAPKAGGRLNRVARGLGELPLVAAAIKIIEFIRGVLLFNVNYFCRLASIIIAGSPPYADPAAGPLRSGSWGHRIPG